MSDKSRCSTCGYYQITLGLCQLPQLSKPGIARKGSYHCPSWKPYKSCSGDCSGDCDGCDDCTCDDKLDKNLSNDDVCGGVCGGCSSSCKDDDSTVDLSDLHWPMYGDLDD